MAHSGDPLGFQPSGKGLPEGRRLVVVLHGWMATNMNDVVLAVREAYSQEPGLDLYVPQLDYGKFFSSTRAATIVSGILAGMDAICADPGRYNKIVLIGFSMGAVFARRLFLAATDVPEPGFSEAHPRHWAGKVERIVTLGGLNRGWLASGRLGWAQSFAANLVGLIGHLLPDTSKPTIFEVRRGAPFIVQTRLHWLAWRRSSNPPPPKPLVIQLLGTQDNLVAPDDAVDLAVDRAPPEAPYFYFDLPNTRHGDAKVFSPSWVRKVLCDPDGKFGAARRKQFIDVLKGNETWLVYHQIRAEYLADTLPDKLDQTVKHVVFVVHGIRDDGYWTRKIAQRIQETASDPLKWHCETKSYGYFAMLPFILPWIRQQKVEWLMDMYVGLRARYPEAAFSYVGHSNGTYLVANALELYAAACFRNVLFAGSVVRCGYDWDALLKAKRVSKVLNMVATRDWVVALFPMGLEPLRRFNLGGAGFGGFDQAAPGRAPEVPSLKEVRYVKGAHSAGLVETQWPLIADFIVHDHLPPANHPDYTNDQSLFWKGVSKISTLLLGLLFVLALAILIYILYPVFTAGTTATKAVMHTLLALLYLLGLRFIITRV